MKKYYKTWPFNFGAIHKQNFDEAKAVIVPMPFEASTSIPFNTGVGGGPYAIISASRYLDELFDAKGDDLVGLSARDIFTIDEVEVSKNSLSEAMTGIESVIKYEVLDYDKVPLMLGGEHSITYGAIKAIKRKYKDISVLHFDAHTDLMQSHEHSKYSHACVMKRIYDLHVPFVSIGIRNFNTEVNNFIEKNKLRIYKAPSIPAASNILSGLTKNVYITFDLDCFDPSIMPSVSTPEPGGLLWYDVIKIIQQVCKKVNIVGSDVVELKPIPGLIAPNFLAAKLTYIIIAAICANKKTN